MVTLFMSYTVSASVTLFMGYNVGLTFCLKYAKV